MKQTPSDLVGARGLAAVPGLSSDWRAKMLARARRARGLRALSSLARSRSPAVALRGPDRPPPPPGILPRDRRPARDAEEAGARPEGAAPDDRVARRPRERVRRRAPALPLPVRGVPRARARRGDPPDVGAGEGRHRDRRERGGGLRAPVLVQRRALERDLRVRPAAHRVPVRPVQRRPRARPPARHRRAERPTAAVGGRGRRSAVRGRRARRRRARWPADRSRSRRRRGLAGGGRRARAASRPRPRNPGLRRPRSPYGAAEGGFTYSHSNGWSSMPLRGRGDPAGDLADLRARGASGCGRRRGRPRSGATRPSSPRTPRPRSGCPRGRSSPSA